MALLGKQCKGIPAGANFQVKRGAVGFSITNSFSVTWKNILSAASIKSLAFPELTWGRVTRAFPSFGVFKASVNGKVNPLSTDNFICTNWQLTGNLLVPATCQETVMVPPATALDAGVFTIKGPA